MPQFSTRRRVQHSASEMFDLVADVERYPEFVPLCQSLAVRKRTPDSEGREVIVADMTIAYKLIRETFTSRVTLDRARLTILVEYLEGPFRRMNNRWSFRPAGDCGLRCRVLSRLRIPQPHAWVIDGQRLRCGVPPLRRGLRTPGRPSLWRAAGLIVPCGSSWAARPIPLNLLFIATAAMMRDRTGGCNAGAPQG